MGAIVWEEGQGNMTSGRRRLTKQSDKQRCRALRPLRLLLEPLEARRLLAGLHYSAEYETDSSAASPVGGAPTIAAGIVPVPAVHAAKLSTTADSLLASGANGEGSTADYALPEDAQPGRVLGNVVFVDPEHEGHYQIFSADSRFFVDEGRLVYLGGELDHETEPLISFTLTVIDEAALTLTTFATTIEVEDVNERPLALRLRGGGAVPEHEPGATVGQLEVVDPDGPSGYAYYIFDDRFVMSGNQLSLRDSVELDYETEPEVFLAVAATDGTHEIFATVRIEVIDRIEIPSSTSSLTLDPQQVSELTAGAVVGTATVVDPSDSSYTFAVSDARFEFVGEQLKLRDDRQIDGNQDAVIPLTITATGDAGDVVSETFDITVVLGRSAHHNYNLPQDVNGDGYVSPIDALIIINEINSNGAHPIPIGGEGEPPTHRIDVNGDGMITPIDVLLIINLLNERSMARARSREFRHDAHTADAAWRGRRAKPGEPSDGSRLLVCFCRLGRNAAAARECCDR